MNHFSNLIFDLDGTLTDPQQGILNSLRFALGKLNFSELPNYVPAEFIGPPLQHSFRNVYNLSEKDTEKAIVLFREYYGTKGLYENEPYDGIEELLSALMQNGKSIYVATSKYAKFAWEILRHFELDKYIIDIRGADYRGTKLKADLINDVLSDYRLHENESLMIGDTVFDIEGARKAGISVLSVGYGFATSELLKENNPDYFTETVDDLSELLAG
jgi:phosphoglycolate phosphatase